MVTVYGKIPRELAERLDARSPPSAAGRARRWLPIASSTSSNNTTPANARDERPTSVKRRGFTAETQRRREKIYKAQYSDRRRLQFLVWHISFFSLRLSVSAVNPLFFGAVSYTHLTLPTIYSV